MGRDVLRQKKQSPYGLGKINSCLVVISTRGTAKPPDSSKCNEEQNLNGNPRL